MKDSLETLAQLFKEFKLYDTKAKRLHQYRLFLKRKEDKYFDNLQKNAISVYVHEFLTKHENIKEERERTDLKRNKNLFFFLSFILFNSRPSNFMQNVSRSNLIKKSFRVSQRC